jgi:hypothetical protein
MFMAGFLSRKIISFLQPLKDDQLLKNEVSMGSLHWVNTYIYDFTIQISLTWRNKAVT